MEKTDKISVEGVPVQPVDDVPKGFTGKDLSEAVKGTWEFPNVKASIDFIKNRWNPLQRTAQKKTIGKTEYMAAQTEVEKFEQNNFASKGVAPVREVTLTLNDRFGTNRKVRLIIGDPELERLPSLNILEVYDQLPWTGSDFENDTLDSMAAHSQQRGGPEPFQNKEDVKARLAFVDLKLDKPAVHELCAALSETTKKRADKIRTDTGQKLVAAILATLPEIERDFNKAAADPSLSPSGDVVGDQTSDVRLALLLNELSIESYDALQRLSQEKGEGFFTLLKKQLFNRHEAILLGPDDYKETEKEE